MKVLYKNKVGKLDLSKYSIYCDNCIYRLKGTNINKCEKVGLTQLCISDLNYSEFILSSSDVLEL